MLVRDERLLRERCTTIWYKYCPLYKRIQDFRTQVEKALGWKIPI